MKSASLRNYLIVSFGVHILVMGTFYIFEKLETPAPVDQAISITLLPAPPEVSGEAKPAAKNLYRPANQIVEQSDQSPDKESPDARFLSAKNQKVEKQTVAANRGDFKNTKKTESAKAGSNEETEVAKKSALPEKTQQQIAEDLLKGFDAKEAFDRQKTAALEKEKGLGDSQGSGQGPQGDSVDASQTNDYIKDVEVGLETVLNTREFKYYSYYNRIRRQLSQHWEGRVRDKLSRLFREGRAPAATNQDRITKLVITLNEKGTLVRIQVLSDSGIRDLDDAAIEAFRAAAPFPNPPQGIVEQDGTVKIRWDFVLEV